MSSPAQLLQNAVALHQAGRLVEAKQAYLKLLRKQPNHHDGLRLLGGLYLQTAAYGSAVDTLEKAVRLRPQDAETGTNFGSALRGLGRRDDAIAQYKKVLEERPDHIAALNNIGSLYHEMGRAPEAMSYYGTVLQIQPEHAVAHFNYGNALLSMGKMTEAATRYEHALELRPDYIEAMVNLGLVLSQAGRGHQSEHYLRKGQDWLEKALLKSPDNASALNNLGNLLRQQGKPEEAVNSFRKALAARADYADAAINLATSLRDLGRFDEALESCRNALRMQPGSANARINLGAVLQELSRHEEAITVFSEALELKPSSIDASWNKALSLLTLGHYEEGWSLHESGLGVAHMRGDNPSPHRRWKGEEIAGKNLLLWSEQGLGDTLQFIRYAELCKKRGARIILLCPPSLRALLKNCPYIDELPVAVEENDFDVHAPLMSLPYIFGTKVETIPTNIPYLFVSDDARKNWEPKLSSLRGFTAGLVWAGNPREQQLNAHLADRRRSLSLEVLKPLFEVPHIQFVSLQMGPKAGQIKELNLQERIFDPMADVKNFDDTAAILEKLDLLISVDTSVVHLAGGMGKPVWVLSRFDACWRWLQNRSDSPWYPSARIFGQEKIGGWASVITKVVQDLKKETA